jgi:hypothetical protein
MKITSATTEVRLQCLGTLLFRQKEDATVTPTGEMP